MRRTAELTYLLPVLLVISLGFLLLIEGLADRNIPALFAGQVGLSDLSPLLITSFPNALVAVCFVAAFLLFHAYLRVALSDADPLILPPVALLSGLGLIMMLRLSPDLALLRNEVISQHSGMAVRNNVATLAQLGMKQACHIMAGILAAIISLKLFSDRFLSRISSKKYLWVALSILLILATMRFGTEINGKRLWLLGMQPVELVKLFLLLFMAGYVYEQGAGLAAASQGGYAAWFRYGGPFVAMCGFALLPLLIQGDLGPTILLAAVFILLFHYAGNRTLVTVVFMTLIGAMGYLSYRCGIPHIVRDRFDKLFDPFGTSENMSRVLWSVSSGGFRGVGIGYGEPYRIPEVQSDFTFAAICEEMGLLGGGAVILAYAVLVHRCLVIAGGAENIYRKTLAAGIGVLLAVQAFIIISGNLNSIPLTGITLPLASYGGSSLIMNFVAIGILLRISERGRCPE